MLFDQDSRRQTLNRVVGQNCYSALQNDGTAVESFIYKMNRAAADVDAGLECLLLRIQSGK